MAVYEVLTEEECYLWAILQDHSGLDLAEFTWYNADAEDDSGCFRAWPFQWSWWRHSVAKQIDQCARSVGKSLSIKVRAFAFPFLFPGQEMVITAPESNHLEAITDIIETQFYATRLGREMLSKSGSRTSITHKPFKMNFANGSRIMGRIPQRDGKGVKGIHPVWLELDEAQDYPEAGWVELIETLKRGDTRAVWRAHGVTRGVRDYFYKFTQESSEWFVHRYVAMCRPNWSADERREKIEEYGSRDAPDYRRNVLGAHGDATNPLFVLHRLMQCVDSDESSAYNQGEYHYVRINDEWVKEAGGDIVPLMQLPGNHLGGKYLNFWVGMDVGLTNSPSEILVFGEYRPAKDKPSKLKLVTRLNLQRISNPDQALAIIAVISFYRPKAFAMDSTGIGLPLFQDIQRAAELNPKLRFVLDSIKSYNFSSKIIVDFDQRVEVDEFRGDPVKDAGIARNVLEYATDKLRELVDHERVLLPWDTDLLGEFQGSTYQVVRSTTDSYGRRKFSGGKDHALDAARMAALGFTQYAIEAMLKPQEPEPVFDRFIAF